MEIVVYDVDGVLVDPSERMERARRSGDFWRTFLDPGLLVLDKPYREMIRRANRDIAAGRLVVLLTGRPERLREATLRELEGFGLNVDGLAAILMRRDRDTRPAKTVKPELLARYAEATGAEVAEIYEDEESIAYELKKRFPGARVYIISRGRPRPLGHLDRWLA